eukprot:5246384-Karenia_brevis.AAC.1
MYVVTRFAEDHCEKASSIACTPEGRRSEGNYFGSIVRTRNGSRKPSRKMSREVNLTKGTQIGDSRLFRLKRIQRTKEFAEVAGWLWITES